VKYPRRRGSVIVLNCLLFVMFISLSALAVDLGWIFIQEGRLSRAMDAGAQAASAQLLSGAANSVIRDAAKQFASANGLTLQDADVSVNPFGNNKRLVYVKNRAAIPTFFAGNLGVPSIQVGYDVYALATADNALLLSAPAGLRAPSSFVPLFVPHADLYPVLTGQATTKAQLASLIFTGNKKFQVGTTYLIKTGHRFKDKIKDICGKGSQVEGNLDFQLAGEDDDDDAYEKYLKQGYGGAIPPGSSMFPDESNHESETRDGVNERVGQDPNSTLWSAKPLSARIVLVPIVKSLATGPDDAGTGVPNLKYLPQVWSKSTKIEVIGYGRFFLAPYSDNLGKGIVSGTFAGYSGPPPNGQSRG
jgi:Flp pilus assembly protein TadG